jgi:hypothetical protein
LRQLLPALIQQQAAERTDTMLACLTRRHDRGDREKHRDTPATIYRWQNEQRPEFYDAMLRAARMRFRLSHPPGYDERPRVPGRKDCPTCGIAVVIRIT